MAGWKSDDGPVTVEFTNGAKVAAGLKVAPAAMKRELRKSARITAREVRAWERAAAQSGSPQQRHMAGGIGASANSTQAILTLQNTISAPGAMGAFLGAKQFPQFPGPIAPGWYPGGPGGPLVINPTLRKREGDIETIWLQGQVDAVARALPRF